MLHARLNFPFVFFPRGTCVNYDYTHEGCFFVVSGRKQRDHFWRTDGMKSIYNILCSYLYHCVRMHRITGMCRFFIPTMFARKESSEARLWILNPSQWPCCSLLLLSMSLICLGSNEIASRGTNRTHGSNGRVTGSFALTDHYCFLCVIVAGCGNNGMHVRLG